MNFTFMLYEGDKHDKTCAMIQKRIENGIAPDFVVYKDELYELRDQENANLKYIKKYNMTVVSLVS